MNTYTVDEMTRWAIENDCCAVTRAMPFGGHMEIRVTKDMVRSGEGIGMLVSYGFDEAVRDVVALALEQADALLIWGDVTSGYNTYEAPVGVAKSVDEALRIISDNNVTGWELL